MKKLFLFLATAALFASCSKKETIENPGGPIPATGTRVKTWTTDVIVSYLYDGQGRVVEENKSNGSKNTYEYAPGLITRKIFNNAGVYQYSYVFELNASGRVTKTTLSNNPGYMINTQYNADGTISKSISVIAGTTNVVDYFYSNGNCDSSRHTSPSGWYLTVVKTYYTDKLNVLNNDVYGQPFIAVDSKNLIKTEIYKYIDGSTNTPAEFFYEFDGQGRVVKKTGKQGANIDIELLTYY